MARFINTLLKEIDIQDKKFNVDHKRILRLINSCGITALTAHKSKRGFRELKYDGKKTDVLLPNCKIEKQHLVTLVDENGKYVHHYQSGGSGQ